MSKSDIGGRIRELRGSAGLNQQQVAIRLGVTQEHISRIENGSRGPSIPLLAGISGLFNTTIDEIVKEPRAHETSQNHN